MNKRDSSLLVGGLFTTAGVIYGVKKAKGFFFFLFVFIVIGGIGSQIGWSLGKQSEENKELEAELRKLILEDAKTLTNGQ